MITSRGLIGVEGTARGGLASRATGRSPGGPSKNYEIFFFILLLNGNLPCLEVTGLASLHLPCHFAAEYLEINGYKVNKRSISVISVLESCFLKF